MAVVAVRLAVDLLDTAAGLRAGVRAHAALDVEWRLGRAVLADGGEGCIAGAAGALAEEALGWRCGGCGGEGQEGSEDVEEMHGGGVKGEGFWADRIDLLEVFNV